MTTKISYSIAEAAEATGLSRSKVHALVQAGEIRSKRSAVDGDGEPAGKYLITAAELERYINGLVDA